MGLLAPGADLRTLLRAASCPRMPGFGARQPLLPPGPPAPSSRLSENQTPIPTCALRASPGLTDPAAGPPAAGGDRCFVFAAGLWLAAVGAAVAGPSSPVHPLQLLQLDAQVGLRASSYDAPATKPGSRTALLTAFVEDPCIGLNSCSRCKQPSYSVDGANAHCIWAQCGGQCGQSDSRRASSALRTPPLL